MNFFIDACRQGPLRGGLAGAACFACLSRSYSGEQNQTCWFWTQTGNNKQASKTDSLILNWLTNDPTELYQVKRNDVQIQTGCFWAKLKYWAMFKNQTVWIWMTNKNDTNSVNGNQDTVLIQTGWFWMRIEEKVRWKNQTVWFWWEKVRWKKQTVWFWMTIGGQKLFQKQTVWFFGAKKHFKNRLSAFFGPKMDSKTDSLT